MVRGDAALPVGRGADALLGQAVRVHQHFARRCDGRGLAGGPGITLARGQAQPLRGLGQALALAALQPLQLQIGPAVDGQAVGCVGGLGAALLARAAAAGPRTPGT